MYLTLPTIDLRNYYNTTPQEQRNNMTEVGYTNSAAPHVTRNTSARPADRSTYAFESINRITDTCAGSQNLLNTF